MNEFELINNYFQKLSKNNDASKILNDDVACNLKYSSYEKIVDNLDGTGILITNQTNFIEISKEHVHPDNYIFTKNFIGLPIFLSEKNFNISFEHTQPPHEYLVGSDKFKKVKQLKEKANEIIFS